MLSHLLFKDKLTILFCLLDEFLALLPKPNRALISGRNPAGRPANLTPSEVLTLALFRFWTTLGNWKAFYALMAAGFRQTRMMKLGMGEGRSAQGMSDPPSQLIGQEYQDVMG
jgi:hypothetical protein